MRFSTGPGRQRMRVGGTDYRNTRTPPRWGAAWWRGWGVGVGERHTESERARGARGARERERERERKRDRQTDRQTDRQPDRATAPAPQWQPCPLTVTMQGGDGAAAPGESADELIKSAPTLRRGSDHRESGLFFGVGVPLDFVRFHGGASYVRCPTAKRNRFDRHQPRIERPVVQVLPGRRRVRKK